jgi:hypothetical protein
MGFTIDRTDDEILIRLPISSTPVQVQNALNFLRYVELGKDSMITASDIDDLVKESKERWWDENKERFRDVEGFEDS